MEAKVYKLNGTETGSVTLNEKVFACKAHPQTINDVVKAQRNNERQGTVSTKNRHLIQGSGRKLYRQKGTGRSRQGDIKSPLQIGGGRVFGPTPRVFDHRPPKKVVDRAIIGVLTEKANEGAFKIFEELSFDSGKTKDVVSFMKSNSFEKVLFVVPEISCQTKRAVGNIKKVKLVTPMNVNVVDLLKYEQVAISDKAVKMLEEVLTK